MPPPLPHPSVGGHVLSSCTKLGCQLAADSPAGKRQAKVELPALWLSITAQEVADEPSLPELLGAAADGGATAVVLRDGERTAGFRANSPSHAVGSTRVACSLHIHI